MGYGFGVRFVIILTVDDLKDYRVTEADLGLEATASFGSITIPDTRALTMEGLTALRTSISDPARVEA